MADSHSLRKSQLRAEVRRRLDELNDRDRRNVDLLRRLTELPEFVSATRQLLYVGTRREVRTESLFTPDRMAAGELAVPWCDGPELRLFRLFAWEELSPGAFQIPEPRPELRTRPEREVSPEDLDLVLVPGVAFDRRGDRVGQGRGYYDRLLSRVRDTTVIVAAAFECQLVTECPHEPHDRPVHIIVTENEVIRC